MGLDPSTRRAFEAFALWVGILFGLILAVTASSQMYKRLRYDPESPFSHWARPMGISRSMLTVSYFAQYGLDTLSVSFLAGLGVVIAGFVALVIGFY